MIYATIGLTYHWSDNSIRSVTIQIDHVDMTGGSVAVTVTNGGATVGRSLEQPHSNGWTNAPATKASMPYPRIFALHDPQYLSTTGLLPPYLPAPQTPDAFENDRVDQFNSWAGGLDYSTSTNANWLFDRSSAMFKAYMTTGRVEFLKEAFLSKQFYFSYVKNDGTAPAPAGGDGCFTYGSTACADGKYIAPQQAKLALALVGDDSQWDTDLIVNMALQADIGWNQYNSRDPFDHENEGLTERGAGLVGLAEINVYEMTGNATVLAHLNERIASLKDMQQAVKAWDTSNGWTPKSGGFTHNINVHEGNESEASALTGNTNARGFSVWMSENIADFLWQTYWITKDSDIPGMLTALAHAVNSYGFTSTYDPLSGNFTKKSEFSGENPRTQSCNTTGDETDLLYFTSAYADATTRSTGDWWSWYSDNHNIETVLILASGYYFETDSLRKDALDARIEKIVSGWVNTNCSKVAGHVYRLWNWQHRSNSVRTWHWVKQN